MTLTYGWWKSHQIVLIWSKDPMAVLNSLEKTFMLKSVGIPEYYLSGNVEMWKCGNVESIEKHRRIRN
jgi:hypothetical protein